MRIPPARVDAGLFVIVAIANCAAIGAEQEPGAKDPDALAYLVGVLVAAPLLVRRRWPLMVLLASSVALMAYHALDYPAIGLSVPLAVALFSAAAAGHLLAAAVVALGLELMAIGFRALEEGESLVTVIGAGTLADVALIVTVLLLAETVRSRRAWAAEVQERLRRTQAEREAAARLRIAHELHDVLAHTIAAIGIQASVAAEALDDSPEAARKPLQAIRAKSVEAMDEVRATIGLLRDPHANGAQTPGPSLDRLEELARLASDARVRVDVAVSGERRPLPALVDLAAARIVQESITNVVRHAGASRARVTVHYEPGAVVVEVADDGRSTSGTGDGYGLTGMRERAAAVGGRLEAGPAPEPQRGFRVHAWLPTERVAA